MGVKDAVARSGTVRIRTAVAATLVVGLTLAASAVVVSVLLRRSLVKNLQDATEVRSADVASLARADDLSPVIPQVPRRRRGRRRRRGGDRRHRSDDRGSGWRFTGGLFVAQDGTNPGANQNFKLVAWDSVVSTN